MHFFTNGTHSFLLYTGTPSPWGLRKNALVKARKWCRSLKLPRSWGPLSKKLLQATTANPKKARKLKAAMAITASKSGLLATLALWTPDNDWASRPMPFAGFLGKFASLSRELTSHSIMSEVYYRICTALPIYS